MLKIALCFAGTWGRILGDVWYISCRREGGSWETPHWHLVIQNCTAQDSKSEAVCTNRLLIWMPLPLPLSPPPHTHTLQEAQDLVQTRWLQLPQVQPRLVRLYARVHGAKFNHLRVFASWLFEMMIFAHLKAKDCASESLFVLLAARHLNVKWV